MCGSRLARTSCCRTVSVFILLLLLAAMAQGASISLVGQGYIPEPNEEVTVYVQTDTPLMLLEVTASITGDVTITGAMNSADCVDYGWDAGWTPDPSIDNEEGRVMFSGFSFAGLADDTVGYFTFIYHGGRVAVSIGGDAYSANGTAVPLAGERLVFGEPEDVFAYPPATSEQQDPEPEYWHYMLPQPDYSTDPNSAVPNEGGGTSTFPLIIDANTTLTQNTIWDRDVILNGSVCVDDCHLVILPGISVYNARGTGGIVVRNNGVLIANGSNELRIGFTSASAQPYQNDYPFAIKLESTASPLCSITNCVVMFADRGIWIDDCRLENPIAQSTFAKCSKGIYQEGPRLTDIVNNDLINCVWTGIEVYLTDANDPNNTCSADTFIAIEHNTIIGYYIDGIWGQFFGIIVHGSPDANNVGYVGMANNIITGSFYYAVVMGDGWIDCDGRYNHGYYDNWEIDTGDPWGDIDPVIVQQDPFLFNTWSWPCLLKPNSPFVDAGIGNVEQFSYLLGTSTYYGFPDEGIADLGVHYNREGFVNAGVCGILGDLNNDFVVDANDLLIFTSHWLEDGNSPTYDPMVNFDDEDLIEFRDFAKFAAGWNERTDGIPSDTPLTFSMDPNELKGDVAITADIQGFVRRTFLLMNGRTVAEFGQLGDDPNTVTLSTSDYPNGLYKFKLVHITDSNSIYITSPVEAAVGNLIYRMQSNGQFHSSNASNRVLSGYYYGTGSLSAEIVDEVNDVVLWSDTFSGSALDIVVPGSAFGDSQLCTLTIVEDEESGGGYLSGGVGDPPASTDEIIELLHRKWDVRDWQYQPVGMAIILPDEEYYEARKRAIIECARACELQRVTWLSLNSHDVNSVNLAYIFGERTDIKYIYWVGRGGSMARWPQRGILPVQRTHTGCWIYKGRKWLDTVEAWEEAGVYSYTQQSVGDAYILPRQGDTKGFDLSATGMPESNARKIVFIDSCNSAAYSDMAEAYGMFSLAGYATNDQIYIGWKRQPEPADTSADMFGATATEAIRLFWEELGQGGDVYDAIYAVYENGTLEMREILFGYNMSPNLGNPSSDDGIGIYGQPGGIDNKLER